MSTALKGILLAIIFSHLALVLVTNRALFASRFNQVYWKDRYEQSQWQLPISSRVIGDDGLYLYEGYRLIKGGSPVDFNAEVPPLGKYAIGASVMIFGNGHFYGFLTMTAALIIFFFLTKKLFTHTTNALMLTALVALDPLITNQFTLTMLDSLWLFFLVLIFLIINKLNVEKSRSIIFGFLGIIFGLFCETKIPVLAPIIILPFLINVIIKKQWKQFVFLLFGFAIGYLLPYWQYFYLGHNLFDWIKTQKWIVGFYQASKIHPTIGNVLTTLLFNQYQDVITRLTSHIPEWSPLWPIITVASLITGASLILKTKELFIWKNISLFIIGVLIFYTVIPFSVRYLVILLPILYLLAAKLFLKLKKGYFILLIFIMINWIASFNILFPTPQATANIAAYAIEHGYFQDLYQELDRTSQTLDRALFQRFGARVYYDGEIESVHAQIWSNHWSAITSPQQANLNITFNTRHLGSFRQSSQVTFTHENGRWKLVWNWNNLIDGLNDNTHLNISVLEAKRGSIIGSDGTTLVNDFPSFMLWITPNKINPATEFEMDKELEVLFHRKIPAVSIHQRYVGNTEPDWPVPIGVIPYQLSTNELTILTRFKAVSLTPHFGRADSHRSLPFVGQASNTLYNECCSLLYTTTSYHGTQGPEAQYDVILSGRNGGSLLLLNADNKIKRTLINLVGKDGQDVRLVP